MNLALRNIVAIVVGLAALSGLNVRAVAAELKSSEIRGSNKKKPDTVLQNRYFNKTLRPEIGVVAGTMINEAYTDTSLYGGRVGLFFNEWVGLEAQFLATSVQDSEDRTALRSRKYRDINDKTQIVNPDPEVNTIKGITDFNAVVAPFYGKLNLMDRFTVYSDFYVTSGFSRVKTDQGDMNAFVAGFGQRFYTYESLSFRLDFRDRMYTERRADETVRKHGMSIDFGASYFFF